MDFSNRRRKLRGPLSDEFDDSEEEESIASERLRKAIERNRRKQEAREEHRSISSFSPKREFSMKSPLPRSPFDREESRRPSRLSPSSQVSSPSRLSPQSQVPSQSRLSPQSRLRSRSRINSQSQMPSSSRSASPIGNRMVRNTSGDLKGRLSSSSVNSFRNQGAYLDRSLMNHKVKEPSPFYLKLQDYLIKGIWIFCGLLSLRLVFSDGGVFEYYDRKKILELKNQEKAKIYKANKDLNKEIKKIKDNSYYQKKLIREHLGFISKDEYLVLFAKEKASKSISK